MNKSLEELRDDYINELADVEKKNENVQKRIKKVRRKGIGDDVYRLERLLNAYEDEKADFEYSIKQLNEYCD